MQWFMATKLSKVKRKTRISKIESCLCTAAAAAAGTHENANFATDRR